MYGTVNRKKKKDGTCKNTYYYVCKHRKTVDGRECSYRRQPPQDRINFEVESLVIDALQSPVFLEAAQKRLNQTIDEDEIKARIESLEKARAQLIGAKNKLSQKMDSLDVSDKHYDAKYEDMQQRFDKFYDEIAEVDDNIKSEQLKLKKIFDGHTTLENAVQMLRVVQDKFETLSDANKKKIFQEMIESVEIFEEPRPDGRQVKVIHLRFPVTVDGETSKDWWYMETHDFRDRDLSRRW